MSVDSLADRIRSEALIADRPGQMARLEAIANEVEERRERADATAVRMERLAEDLVYLDVPTWVVDKVHDALNGADQ